MQTKSIVIIAEDELQLLLTKINRIEKILLDLQGGDSEGETPLTRVQLSEKYSLPLSTVDELKRKGVLPFHKLGKHVYFYPSEVNAVIKKLSCTRFVPNNFSKS